MAESTDQRVLKITLGEEYKAKIESQEDFEKSIFQELYTKAVDHVAEIVAQSNSKELDYNPELYNNIISFTGERGTGKTSAMTSFVNALAEGKINPLNSFNFAKVPMIDPSLFRSKDGLFEIIIATMFSEFQERITDIHAPNINPSDKRELLDAFQKVFKDLKIIHQDKKDIYEKEVIEALSDLAYGTNLKYKFFELIKTYLKVLKDDADFLIIPIDDFDLNLDGAYNMLEDIRQYLIQKKIILIIACKMGQLKDSLRQKIVFKTKELFNDNVIELDGYSTEDLPKDKAERYLEKLIPLNRRLFTESVRFDLSCKVKLIQNGLIRHENSVEDLIIKLIYEKSKVFIPIVKTGRNYFIQPTLRQLIQQIRVVNDCNSPEKIAAYFENLKSDFLSEDDLILFNETIKDHSNLNRLFLEWFDNKLIKTAQPNLKPERLIDFSIEHSISYGDLFSSYYLLGSNLKLINFKEQKSTQFLALNYSIQNTIKAGDKNERKSILNYGYFIPGMLFPEDNVNKDGSSLENFGIENWREFMDEFESENELQFILCFISSIGGERVISSRVLERRINIESRQFNKVQFNAMNFVTVLFNNDIHSYEPLYTDQKENSLYSQIKSWEYSGIDLFSNLFFSSIFKSAYGYSYERLRKDGELSGKPSLQLKNRIIKGYEGAIQIMKTNFSFIDLDSNSFINNPIFKFWNENEERANYLIDKLYEQFYKRRSGSETNEGIARLASNLLQQYSNYFQGNFRSPQGAKMGINNLINNFKGNLDIYDRLQSHRWEMNEDLERGLRNIELELQRLIKNG